MKTHHMKQCYMLGRGLRMKIKAIHAIYFELSNICNYSYFHKKCPLHYVVTKQTLPLNVIKKAISELKSIEYDNSIWFNNYNEPLSDPRLFYIINYVKTHLNKSKIHINTNGFYLDQNLADELYECGVDEIIISLYSKEESERLRAIKFSMDVHMSDYATNSLDDRNNIYQRELLYCNLPCYSLETEIIIRYTGDVGLCCLDWDNRYNYGNLNHMSLEEILGSSCVQEITSQLKKGKRQLEICKRCNWQRGNICY